MAPVRLRHPKGVTTIQVDFDAFTVLDLQQEVYAACEIPPSLQILKVGYPPISLELVPELPLASLGLKQGDQLIVGQKAAGSPAATPTPATVAPARAGSFPSVSSASPPRNRAPPANSASRPAFAVQPPASASGPDYVETDGGVLVHRIVPDDNSCLFSAVALIFEQSIDKAQAMRRIVADAIRADPETWSDAILGRPPAAYITTILTPSAWGGAIELSILAAHYRTTIASVDVESGRVDSFSPLPSSSSSPTSSGTGMRALLLYSGIHYDAATLAPTPDAPGEWHQTLFPADLDGGEDPILKAALVLADKLRAKRAFTNTATFDLKCEICKKGLKGQKEASTHAAETGHTAFGEY